MNDRSFVTPRDQIDPELPVNAARSSRWLKHPSLRGEGGELLSLVGMALCRLNPARGKDAGTDDEFHLDAGKGARAVADALLAAVRILGVRSPDVFLLDEAGPPLSLVFTTEPRLLVGKLAVKKEVTDAELRFFAGRALFTQQPELMALRSLRREQVLRGLVLVSQVAEGRASPPETKLFREARARARVGSAQAAGAGRGHPLDLARSPKARATRPTARAWWCAAASRRAWPACARRRRCPAR